MVLQGWGNTIWTAIFNSAGKFMNDSTQILGAILSAPALAWNPNYPGGGRMQMAVRGLNDTIWASTFDSTGTFMNDWVQIPGATLSGPALAWNPNYPGGGRMQMAVRGLNDTIWASTFDSTGTFMNDWVQIPGATLSGPALAWNQGTGKMQIAVRGGGDSIWTGTFDSVNGTFNNDWVQISGMTPSGPALAWNQGTGKMQIAVRGGGNTIWTGTFDPITGTFNDDWIQIPGSTPSAPGMVYLPSGYMCIVVRGLDNAIWEMLF
jgi:hypothetical protein